MTNTSLFKRGFTAFLAMLVCLSSFMLKFKSYMEEIVKNVQKT